MWTTGWVFENATVTLTSLLIPFLAVLQNPDVFGNPFENMSETNPWFHVSLNKQGQVCVVSDYVLDWVLNLHRWLQYADNPWEERDEKFDSSARTRAISRNYQPQTVVLNSSAGGRRSRTRVASDESFRVYKHPRVSF